MSQISDNYASVETFPYFNQTLVTPLQIGGLGVQLLLFEQPLRLAKKGILSLPKGFSQKEYHSVKESEDTPQEDVLEVGYVRDVELSR